MHLPQRSSFCTAEIGSKVFAVFNLVVASVSSLVTIGAFIFFGTKIILDIKSTENSRDSIADILSGAFVVVVLMLSLVALMFAVFLLNGVLKKKPEHMHAYFVYGVFVEILSVLASFLYTYLYVEDNLSTPLATFSICFVYGLILYMIRKTYKEFQSLNQQYNHQPMVEKC